MAEGMEERRGFVRIPFNTDAEIRAGDRTARSSNGIDVGMGGVRMSTADAVLPEGAECDVKITLRAPESRVFIEAKGTVVRSEPGVIAVQFTEMDLDSYQHLRQLILYNTTEPEKAEKQLSSHWGIKTPNNEENK